MQKQRTLALITLASLALSGCGGSAIPQDEIPADTTPQSGASQQTQAMQTLAGKPSENWSLHFTAKKLFPGNPDTTVNKYCKSVVGNMTQCQLYDGNDTDSRLVGVETIVGPEMYGTFTDGEKKMWMPTKDLLLATSANMPDPAAQGARQAIASQPPDADAQQFANVAQSFSSKYSKVYLLWDPGKINIPTGSPMMTVMNTSIASGTVAGTTAAPTLATTAATNGQPAPVSNGGFTYAAFDIAKLLTAGLTDVKGNFESSILQRNNIGSLELYKLKDRIGLHEYTNTTHLMFIVSGKGEFTIGDGTARDGGAKKVPVNGGMVVVIPAGTPHAFKNLGGKDAPLVFVTFKNPYDEGGVKWME